MMNRILRNSITTFAIFSIAACGDEATAPTPVQGATLTITPPTAVVYEADAVVLTAVYRDANGNVAPDASITWSMQDTVRAQLGANGYVLALKSGVVKVTAKSGNLTATYDLAIVRPTVLSVAVLLQTATVSRGDVVTVGVHSNGPGGRVVLGRLATLSSDNSNVAAIDAAGRVRAVAAGTTTIRATVDGVVGTAQVTITDANSEFELSRFNGARLPMLLASDTVMWNGVKEYHEMYVESGSLRLSGNPLRYHIKVSFYEYNVVIVNGQRVLQPRMPQGENDWGLVQYDARGDLQMTSEYTAPLSHTAVPESGGMQMNFRVPGDNEVWQLFFRREPQ